ncbi:Flp family type IVb pilin [Chelativorans sp. M5D2P16]|uniref:Flp family type IVb pilin n=1 Tax=Chelativorans sp. M5D2P16 TaxID=3095678 RepID=UPI002ACA8A22|nr:Flp family type IVb pilin [Chelativorans sp. M5D2P16]MDZ5699884.1 Flp family type IVb pilin [Chelativorans sp. M5D2P16]
MLKEFVRSNKGASAVECALIAGILALAIIASATELGRLVGEAYGGPGQSLATAVR